MPFVTSKLDSRTKTITRKFQDGQSVSLRYKPHVYSLDEQLELESVITNESLPTAERADRLVQWICDTIEWCDWQEVEGGPEIPITQEEVRKQKFDLVMFLFTIIGEDKKGKR